MFNIRRTGAARLPGRPRAIAIIQVMLGLFLCVVLWAVAHYEFGLNSDRAHSRGSRLYRINSYEQFIKEKAGDDASLLA